MKTLLFIYNPTAGKGQIAASLGDILDILTKTGWLVTAYPTQDSGDAARVARELGPNYDRVVCAGGDGTLSETVSGLLELEQSPPLGYIPFGSTNDCAANLDLPKSPPHAALTAGETGVLRPIDMGRLNDRTFVYVAAFGAFTQVSYETPQDLKNLLGHMAYILGGIASLPTITPYHLRIEYDDQVLEDDFYFGMIRNAYSIGGLRLPKSERVELDDGLFEVDLIKKPVSLADLADGFQSLLTLSSLNGGTWIHFRTSKLTVTCDKEMPWTVDGEFGGSYETCEIINQPRAITLICGK